MMVEKAGYKKILIQPSHGNLSETSIFSKIACLSMGQNQTVLKLIMTLQIYEEMGTHASISAQELRCKLLTIAGFPNSLRST